MRRLTGNRLANAVIIIALSILPLLYTSMLTWAYEAPIDRLDRIPAAVVNLDRAHTATLPDGTTQRLSIGQELTKRLTTGDKQGFGWVSADENTARKGLENGTYQAMLLIPSDLSTNLATMSNPEAAGQQQTTIHLYTNDGVNYLTGTMAQSVSLNLEKVASTQASRDYIDSLLISMGTIKSGLTEGARGAGQIADGGDQLRDGAESLHSGTTQLKDGSGQLASGADTLTVGVGELADGASRLNAGSHTLADGIARYTAGAGELSAGIDTLADGLTKPQRRGQPSFQEGMSSLDAQLHPGRGQRTIADGANQLAEGAKKADAGVDALADGARRLVGGIEEASSGADQLSDGSARLAAGANQLADALVGPQDVTLAQGADQMGELAAGLKRACSGIGRIDPVCICLNRALRAKGLSTDALPGEVAKLQAGVRQAGDAAREIANGGHDLNAGATRLAAALKQGADPDNPTIHDGATKLLQAALATPDGATNPTSLKDATSALASGTDTLARGVAEAGSGSRSLTNALNGLIVPGVSQLQAGGRELTGNSPALLDGARQATDGTAALSNGAQRAASGSKDLASGAHRLDSGLNEAQAGAKKLADGSRTLSLGANELTKRLDEGADKIPQLSKAQANKAADVASQPIAVEPTRLNAVSTNGIGFSSFFMALSLYIGAIGIFFVIPALDLRRSRTEPFFVCALRSAMTASCIATIQAIIVVVALELLLDLQAADIVGLIGACVLSSLTFVAINQAVIALFGFRGRFVSLLLMCLQLGASAGTFAIETTPGFLQAANKVLPMSYTVRAIRDLTAGASVPLGTSLAVLCGWMLSGILITLIAAKRRTGLKPMPYDPALAYPGSAPEDTASLIERIGDEPAHVPA